MAGRPNRQQAVHVARRRQDAFELRLAGIDLVTIGRKLAADPLLNSDGLAYPQGYGCDLYAAGDPPPDDEHLAELVSTDLRRALRARSEQVDAAAVELREIQHARLERLFVIAWRQALAGGLDAVDRAIRVLERQAKLFGLDAPVRTELTGDAGQLAPADALAAHRQAAIAYLDELAAAAESRAAPGGPDAAAADSSQDGGGADGGRRDDGEQPPPPALAGSR